MEPIWSLYKATSKKKSAPLKLKALHLSKDKFTIKMEYFEKRIWILFLICDCLSQSQCPNFERELPFIIVSSNQL